MISGRRHIRYIEKVTLAPNHVLTGGGGEKTTKYPVAAVAAAAAADDDDDDDKHKHNIKTDLYNPIGVKL